MTEPRLATVDPVDGTLYVVYGDGTVWAYRPPAEERLREGWKEVVRAPGSEERSAPVSSS